MPAVKVVPPLTRPRANGPPPEETLTLMVAVLAAPVKAPLVTL